MEGRIINITRCCTDDGPGIRTTVFLKGCPLRCIWCHNPESQRTEPERWPSGEEIGRTVTAQAVVEEVLRDRVFYDLSGGGVTLSGGEPLLQPDFTARVLMLCREQGIHTAVETSGCGSREALEKILPHCDLMLFDIKETNREKHLLYTGGDLERILENLRAVDRAGVPIVLRLPIIPGKNDREEHFAAVMTLARSLACCRGVEVMPYHKLGEHKYEQLGRPYPCAGTQEPEKSRVELWRQLTKL